MSNIEEIVESLATSTDSGWIRCSDFLHVRRYGSSAHLQIRNDRAGFEQELLVEQAMVPVLAEILAGYAKSRLMNQTAPEMVTDPRRVPSKKKK